jgi:hypothetical protein
MAFTNSFTNMTTLIADQAMGDDRYNQYRENIEFLKESYEVEHSITTGRHYRPGFIAAISFTSNGTSDPTSISHNHNFETTITRLAVGTHKIQLSVYIQDDAPCLASVSRVSTTLGYAYNARAWVKNENSVSYCYVQIFDYTGSNVDPATTTAQIHIAIALPEASGSFDNSWLYSKDAAATDVMNVAAYNKMINNLQVLYDRVKHGHTVSTGSHKKIGASLGARGVAQGTGNPASVTGHNYTGFIRVSTGVYKITLDTSVLPSVTRVPCFCSTEDSSVIITCMVFGSGGAYWIIAKAHSRTTGALTDIGLGNIIGAICVHIEDY